MLNYDAIKILEKRGFTIIKHYSSGTCTLLQNGNLRVIIKNSRPNKKVESISCYDDSSGENLCIASTETALNIITNWANGLSVEKMMEILNNESNTVVPKFAQYKIMQDLDKLAG